MTSRLATPRNRDKLKRLLGRRSPSPLSTPTHVTAPTPPLAGPNPTTTPSATLQVPGPSSAANYLGGVNGQKDHWGEALLSLSPADQSLVQQHTQSSWTGTDLVIVNLEEILAAARDKRKLVEDGRWTVPIGKHISVWSEAEKVIRWLDRFKQAGDVAVNADPMHAGLPWAAIRLLLQAVVSDQEQLDALFSGLERVMYILSRCKVDSELYVQIPPSSAARSNVDGALHGLYTLLLQFLVQALRVLEKNTASRALHAFWKPEEILAFEKKCSTIEERVEIEMSNLERIIQKDYRREDAQRFTQLLQDLDAIKSLRRPIEMLSIQVDSVWTAQSNAFRAEVLTWTSTIPHLDQHDNAVRGRTNDTGNWLFQNPQYQHWHKSSDSVILWLHGIPGAGKTKLVTRVVDEFRNKTHYSGLGFFYCDGSDETRRDAENILRSYVKQLAVSPAKDEIHRNVLDIYKDKKHAGFASSKLSIEESEELLHKLIKAFPMVTLVLDALDECREKDRSQLIKVFGRLISSSKAGTLKVFVSSRRNDDIKRQLRKEANLGIEATNNEDDIRKFVLGKLDEETHRRANEWLPPISPDLQQEIANTLFDKSRGMFQWAALQIGQLLDLERESDIRARLGKLPEGLQEAYDDILSTIRNQKGSKPTIATRAFTWIIASTIPPELDVLLAAVCQDPESDEITLPDVDKDYVIGACQNLVTVDARNRCHFAHLSVEEYFESTAFRNTAQCDRDVVNVYLTMLLNVGDEQRRAKLDSEIAYSIELQKLYVGAAFWWPGLITRSEKYCCENKTTLALLMSFLGLPEKASPAYLSWHQEAQKLTPDASVKGDWIFSPLEPAEHPILAACCIGIPSVLEAWHKATPINTNLKNAHKESLLWLAFNYIEHGCVEFLINNGADTTDVINNWDQDLLLDTFKKPADATQPQDVNTLRIIIIDLKHKHLEVFVVGSYFERLLVKACDRGYTDVVKLLLEFDFDLNYKDSVYGSALCAACLETNGNIVALLLDAGADINLTVPNYQNALGAACRANSQYMVDHLLSLGADLSTRADIIARAESQNHEVWKRNIMGLLRDKHPSVGEQGDLTEESRTTQLLRRYSDDPLSSELPDTDWFQWFDEEEAPFPVYIDDDEPPRHPLLFPPEDPPFLLPSFPPYIDDDESHFPLSRLVDPPAMLPEDKDTVENSPSDKKEVVCAK